MKCRHFVSTAVYQDHAQHKEDPIVKTNSLKTLQSSVFYPLHTSFFTLLILSCPPPLPSHLPGVFFASCKCSIPFTTFRPFSGGPDAVTQSPVVLRQSQNCWARGRSIGQVVRFDRENPFVFSIYNCLEPRSDAAA